MRVAEIFQSIQGEGEYEGTPSVFVRLSGCNLRCWFCDTSYTSWRPEGEQRAWQSVLDEARAFDCRHVVITGGEPLLQRDVVPLSKALGERGHFVTIETAGTVLRDVHADLMSISPKLTNSTPVEAGRWTERHEQQRHRPEVITGMTVHYPYQFKFVIDEPGDLEDAEEYLRRFPHVDPQRVWLMPQAIDRAALAKRTVWLKPEAIRRGYRFATRRHIELFGNTRGT